MAETPEAFSDDPSEAFAFSDDAKREIQSILGDADQSVLSQLQSVAATHVLDAATDYMSPLPVRELRKMLTALGRVIRCVDQASYRSATGCPARRWPISTHQPTGTIWHESVVWQPTVSGVSSGSSPFGESPGGRKTWPESGLPKTWPSF
jgi:hypothetical protein